MEEILKGMEEIPLCIRTKYDVIYFILKGNKFPASVTNYILLLKYGYEEVFNPDVKNLTLSYGIASSYKYYIDFKEQTCYGIPDEILHDITEYNPEQFYYALKYGCCLEAIEDFDIKLKTLRTGTNIEKSVVRIFLK